jgi:hypothetical protein
MDADSYGDSYWLLMNELCGTCILRLEMDCHVTIVKSSIVPSFCYSNWLSWEQVSSLLLMDGRARPLVLAAHLLLDAANRAAADVVDLVRR